MLMTQTSPRGRAGCDARRRSAMRPAAEAPAAKAWCGLRSATGADLAATILWRALRPAPAAADDATASGASDLRNLSIEQLADIDISSVSKTSEPLSDAAASVYVITHDEIVRSGATTLPEMLRLAPNLQAAQISATSYAISTRGPIRSCRPIPNSTRGSAGGSRILSSCRSPGRLFCMHITWNM